jgi:methylated-DNA-[protein]-cysteine S-methyltransferase
LSTQKQGKYGMETARRPLRTPVGTLLIEASDDGLSALRWPAGAGEDGRRGSPAAEANVDAAEAWLEAYFAGRPLPPLPRLAPGGTEFQRAVWRALVAIPKGTVRTYGELAAALGRPGAARAVGQANGRNPIAIIVPCHRVVASGGKLGGYSSGLPRKRWLLAHEGQTAIAGA